MIFSEIGMQIDNNYLGDKMVITKPRNSGLDAADGYECTIPDWKECCYNCKMLLVLLLSSRTVSRKYPFL